MAARKQWIAGTLRPAGAITIDSGALHALFEGKSVQRCLVDLLSRESKDELADLPPWLAGRDRPGHPISKATQRR